MPSSLSYEQGSTLTCAGLTAWNALYGSKPLAPGDVVLTQGTGGVSIFAVQFAKAAGATVIATTSSTEKAERLKQLGADHVINYKEVKDWGKEAKKLTPRGEGVDHVVEVGGPESIKQSFEAIKMGGVISVIGFVGGVEGGPGFLEPLMRICTVRGILVGSRVQFEAMVSPYVSYPVAQYRAHGSISSQRSGHANIFKCAEPCHRCKSAQTRCGREKVQA